MKRIKLKPRAIQLVMLLFMAMLLPSRSIAQGNMWNDGLFNRGPVSENMAQEEFYRNQGYRGGLFNPTTSPGYNVGTQIFGSDVNGGFNIYTQQFGYEEEAAPLDGGWIVLTLAGATYAFKKRKNNNKQ